MNIRTQADATLIATTCTEDNMENKVPGYDNIPLSEMKTTRDTDCKQYQKESTNMNKAIDNDTDSKADCDDGESSQRSHINNFDIDSKELSGVDGLASDNKQSVDTRDVDSGPDGGWGWVIVLSSMLIHFIIAGFNRGAGILYLKFLDRYKESFAITAWVTSLSVSLTLLAGPIASILCQRFSYRKVVIAGGIILSLSMLISGFSSNIYILFVSYGVIGGIGKALAYGPGVVIVSLYFTRRRSLAIGLATSGVALGSFAVPFIVEVVFAAYGYSIAFVVMTGISLVLVVCGGLLKPISQKHNTTETNTNKESNRPSKEAKEQTERNNKNTNKMKMKCTATDIEYKAAFKPNLHEKTEANERRKFSLLIFKNIRFAGLCTAIFFYFISFKSAVIFLPALSVNIDKNSFESFPVVVIGIFDGISRILFGLIFDCPKIKPIRMYVYTSSILLLGVVTFVIPSVRTTPELGVVCAIFGLFLGNCVAQQSIIIEDILGVDHLSNGFGILSFFGGIGTLIGPPIAGLMKDIYGSYKFVFYIGGVSGVVGAFILFGANIIHSRLPKNKNNKKETK